MLTIDQKKFFHEQGYLVLPGAHQDEEQRRPACDALEAFHNQVPAPDLAEFRYAHAPEWRESDDCKTLIDFMKRYAEAVLGPGNALVQPQGVQPLASRLGAASYEKHTGAHVDATSNALEDINGLGFTHYPHFNLIAGMSLTPGTRVRVWPNSHLAVVEFFKSKMRLGALSVQEVLEAFDDEGFLESYVTRDGVEPMELLLGAGDLYFMHYALIHAAANGELDETPFRFGNKDGYAARMYVRFRSAQILECLKTKSEGAELLQDPWFACQGMNGIY